MPVKYEVEIARAAEIDIAAIWEYIANDSSEMATRFVLRLEEKINTLERSPLRCPSIPENNLLETSYRHLIVDDYRIIFRVERSTVIVLRVLHGNRLLDFSSLGS